MICICITAAFSGSMQSAVSAKALAVSGAKLSCEAYDKGFVVFYCVICASMIND